MNCWLKQNKLEQSIINKNEATTILHAIWYRDLKILFYLNYAFFLVIWSEQTKRACPWVSGKLSDGVKI